MSAVQPRDAGAPLAEARRSSAPGASSIALAVVALLYALQLAAPLLISTDSWVYLGMARSAAAGNGFYPRRGFAFPPGYPAALALLLKLGLWSRLSLLVLNFASLLLGFSCAHRILRRTLGLPARLATGIVAVSAFSICSTFPAVHVWSDALYFGLSMASLLFLVRSEERSGGARWEAIGMGALLAISALTVRSAGIALLAAAAVAALEAARSAWPPPTASVRERRIALTYAALAGLAGLGFTALAARKYAREAFVFLRWTSQRGLERFVSENVVNRLSVWAEVACNFQTWRIPAPYLAAWALVGACVLGIVAAGVLRVRARSLAAAVFLLANIAILCVYPGFHFRYWLPMLPLLAGCAAPLVTPLLGHKALRLAFALFVAGFCLAGTDYLVRRIYRVATGATPTGLPFRPERFDNPTYPGH